jgi:hypothetical protein
MAGRTALRGVIRVAATVFMGIEFPDPKLGGCMRGSDPAAATGWRTFDEYENSGALDAWNEEFQVLHHAAGTYSLRVRIPSERRDRHWIEWEEGPVPVEDLADALIAGIEARDMDISNAPGFGRELAKFISPNDVPSFIESINRRLKERNLRTLP